MSAPFLSPAPWTYRDAGGAATVVDRYGQTVAILARGMEPGNGAVMAAAPELLEALRFLEEATFTAANRLDAPSALVMAHRQARAALAKADGQ
jgi:hypothetical protein